MPNLYQILNVDPFASTAEISEAAKKLIAEWNPDTLEDRKTRAIVTAVLKEITDARDVLTDSWKRQKYDVKIGLADIVYRTRKPRKLTSDKSVQYGYDYTFGQPMGDIQERIRKRSLEMMERESAGKDPDVDGVDTTVRTTTREYETDTTRMITTHQQDIFYITGKKTNLEEESQRATRGEAEGFEKLDQEQTSVDFTTDIYEKTQRLDPESTEQKAEIGPIEISYSRDVPRSISESSADEREEVIKDISGVEIIRLSELSKKTGEKLSAEQMETTPSTPSEYRLVTGKETVKISYEIQPTASKQIIEPEQIVKDEAEERILKDELEEKIVKDEPEKIIMEEEPEKGVEKDELEKKISEEKSEKRAIRDESEKRAIRDESEKRKIEKEEIDKKMLKDEEEKRMIKDELEKKIEKDVKEEISVVPMKPLEESGKSISSYSEEIHPTLAIKRIADLHKTFQRESRELQPLSVKRPSVEEKIALTGSKEIQPTEILEHSIKQKEEVLEEKEDKYHDAYKESITEMEEKIIPEKLREAHTKERQEEIAKHSLEPHPTMPMKISADLEKTILKETEPVTIETAAEKKSKISEISEVSKEILPTTSPEHLLEKGMKVSAFSKEIHPTEIEERTSEEEEHIVKDIITATEHKFDVEAITPKDSETIEPTVTSDHTMKAQKIIIQPTKESQATISSVLKPPIITRAEADEEIPPSISIKYSADTREEIPSDLKDIHHPPSIERSMKEAEKTEKPAEEMRISVSKKPLIDREDTVKEGLSEIKLIKSADDIDPRIKTSKVSEDIGPIKVSERSLIKEDKISKPVKEVSSIVDEDSRKKIPIDSKILHSSVSTERSIKLVEKISGIPQEIDPSKTAKPSIDLKKEIPEFTRRIQSIKSADSIVPRKRLSKDPRDIDTDIYSDQAFETERKISEPIDVKSPVISIESPTIQREKITKISRSMQPVASSKHPVQIMDKVSKKRSAELREKASEDSKSLHPVVSSRASVQVKEKISTESLTDLRQTIKEKSKVMQPVASLKHPVQIKEVISTERPAHSVETITKVSMDLHPDESLKHPVQIEKIMPTERPVDSRERITEVSRVMHPDVSSKLPVQIEKIKPVESLVDSREMIPKISKVMHPDESLKRPVRIEEIKSVESLADSREIILKAAKVMHPVVSSKQPVQMEEIMSTERPVESKEPTMKVSRDMHPVESLKFPMQIEEIRSKSAERLRDSKEMITEVSRVMHPDESLKRPVRIEEIIPTERPVDSREMIAKVSKIIHPVVSLKLPEEVKEITSKGSFPDLRETTSEDKRDLHLTTSTKIPIHVDETISIASPTDSREPTVKQSRVVYPVKSSKLPIEIAEKVSLQRSEDLRETITDVSKVVHPVVSSKHPVKVEGKVSAEPSTDLRETIMKDAKAMHPTVLSKIPIHIGRKISTDRPVDLRESITSDEKEIHPVLSLKHPIKAKEIVSRKSKEAEESVIAEEMKVARPAEFPSKKETKILKYSKEVQPVIITEEHVDVRKKVSKDLPPVYPSITTDYPEEEEKKILIQFKKVHSIESLEYAPETEGKELKGVRSLQSIEISQHSMEPEEKISEVPSVSYAVPLKHDVDSKENILKYSKEISPTVITVRSAKSRKELLKEPSEKKSSISLEFPFKSIKKVSKDTERITDSEHLDYPKEVEKKASEYSKEIQPIAVTEHTTKLKKKISKESKEIPILSEDHMKTKIRITEVETKVPLTAPLKPLTELEKKPPKDFSQLHSIIRPQQIVETKESAIKFSDEKLHVPTTEPMKKKSKKISKYLREIHPTTVTEHFLAPAKKVSKDLFPSIPSKTVDQQEKVFKYPKQLPLEKRIAKESEKIRPIITSKPSVDARAVKDKYPVTSTEYIEEQMKTEEEVSHWKRGKQIDKIWDQKPSEMIYKKKKKHRVSTFEDDIECPVERKVEIRSKYDNGVKHGKYSKEQQKYSSVSRIKDKGDVEDGKRRKEEEREKWQDEKKQIEGFHKHLQTSTEEHDDDLKDVKMPIRAEYQILKKIKDEKHIEPSSELHKHFRASRISYKDVDREDRTVTEYYKFTRITKSISESSQLSQEKREASEGQLTCWIKEDDEKSGKFSISSREYLDIPLIEKKRSDISTDSKDELRHSPDRFPESHFCKHESKKREKKKKSKYIKESSLISSEAPKSTFESEEVSEYGKTECGKATLESSFMAISVSACSKDSETKTIYTYDVDGERIEVFVEGIKRIHISKGSSEESYSSKWVNSASSCSESLCSSTVIDANGSKIITLRVCDGRQESISVHKDHILLCKVSSSKY
ncbi:microtubule-associated protein futsch-like [Argiope bruennichi]|uniref:microtubule-associated protein futsch-like n=1 Tax=Argiope bruennichi TaxID=94029 RepID=UPI0024951231|nr:microtubule-associated protein futsch-like [Argiope bruennichi]